MAQKRIRLVRLVLLALVALSSSVALGHGRDENYVWLNIDDANIEGRFEFRLPDLNTKFGFDLPEGYEEALAQLPEIEPLVQQYIREHFEMRADGRAIPFEFTTSNLLRSDLMGHFAQFYYRTPSLEVPASLEIVNSMLLDGSISDQHRSLLCMEYNRKSGTVYSAVLEDPAQGETPGVPSFTALVFAPATTEQTLDLLNITGMIPVKGFVWQGAKHLWLGISCVFLIGLLASTVMVASRSVEPAEDDEGESASPPRQWVPAPGVLRAIANMVVVFTAFGIAYTAALALGALGMVQVPLPLVLAALFASVVLIAVHNVRPILYGVTWLVVLFFGFFHGLGLASDLSLLPFRMRNLKRVALAFNIGADLAVVGLVLVLFPLAFLLRKSSFYQPVIMKGGSGVLVVLAAVWLAQRLLHL